jgi:phage terminase large subunit
MHLIIKCNYTDNPWHGELEGQRIWDYNHLPRAKYDHIWLGEFNDSIEDPLITAEWFDACIDAHKRLGFEPLGIRYAAHDPSDIGPDSKGFAFRHGSVVLDIREKTDGTVNDGNNWAMGLAINHNVDAYTWDCDGMGVGLNRQVEQGLTPKRVKVEMYKGSMSPRHPDRVYETIGGKPKTNKETFMNQRAQGYWELRERMRKTYLAVEKGEYQDPDSLCSLSSEIASIGALRSELCRIPKVPNGAGKIQLMRKEDMKKKGIKSPNMADSVMMAMFYEPQIKDEVITRAPIPSSSRW